MTAIDKEDEGLQLLRNLNIFIFLQQLNTKDNYPKMILGRTKQEEYQMDGIIVKDLVDWLGEAV